MKRYPMAFVLFLGILAVAWAGGTPEDPERYAPAFGSYCAYGVSEGRLLDNDPDAWTIHDDVLYLNANIRTRDRFQDDTEKHIRRAQENWPELRPDR